MNPLEELRLAAYLLTALGIAAGAAWATHRLDTARYETLNATFATYQAQAEKNAAASQAAAAAALQAEIARRTDQESKNAQIVSQLTDQASAARSDAEFARRLLAAAAAPPAASAGGHQNGPADHQPAAPGAPGAPGDRSLAQDLGAAAGECRDAIERLAALQSELIPQLKVTP